LLVAAGTGSFLKKDPRVRSIIEVKSKQIEADADNSTFTILKRIFRNYDLAISMNASDRGNIAAILAGRRDSLGFYENKGLLKSFWRKLLLGKAIPYDTECHAVRICEKVADSLNIPVNKLKVIIYWDKNDACAVNDALKMDSNSQPYIVMHPFARWDYKYWPMDNFVQLNDRLFESFGIRTVWTSSPAKNELEQLDKYSAKCRHKPLTIPGNLTLNQITCLIAGSCLYIGLDTAVTHLAASTNVPMIALYGPTITRRWSPWNNTGAIDQFADCNRGKVYNGHILLFQENCKYENCIRPLCNDQCMTRIQAEQVYSDATQLLQKSGFKMLNNYIAEKP